MGEDRRRDKRDDDNDMSRLKMLAKLMRGAKPPQKSKFHERKPKQTNLKDLAATYNRDGEVEETE